MATTTTLPTLSAHETERLLREAASYLLLVEAFRDHGVEPAWASDETRPDWWFAEWASAPQLDHADLPAGDGDDPALD